MQSPRILKGLKPPEARRLILEILESGVVHVSGHARKELANDRLDLNDCINVLRGGVVQPPDHQNGEWRYRVGTNRMCVVVAFESETELRVVTAWRMQQ